ncbi:MAG: nicotinate-nucleotide--dimethylbenzimidazole phosphoribosyltransferase [Clostridiales bacterium]|nr:nicotinate-nucleotide--dimethylbenzimidazole phosphoribosyltransferase [Clostridiales bacterium]
MTLKQVLENIKPLDKRAMEIAKSRWDSIAKPLNSLGMLEKAVIQIAGIYGDAMAEPDKRAVIVMCADNGVVEEGVTQAGKEVTAIVTENFTKGNSCVCKMARCAGADVIPVDIGVACDVSGNGLMNKKIAYGTKNMTKEAAMTREQAIQAIETGISIVFDLTEKGYRIFATGEMGIGNTTTSSAIVSVLLQKPVEEVTGRGAGLSTEGLQRKINAIKKAIEKNCPNANDPIDVLCKVGGLDIAGLAGVFIGGAALRVPVLVDGFISAASALIAIRICPQVADYILATHVSKEPAGNMMMEALKIKPFLNAEMCLGEGTGAVTILPILDMAYAVYRDMSTFSEIDVEEYKPLT